MTRMVRIVGVVVVGAVVFAGRYEAQDRLDRMPGVAEFRKMQTALQGGAFVSGAITPTWAEDSKGFTYTHSGSRFRFDVTTLAAVHEGAAPSGDAGGRGGRAGGGRGGRGGASLGGCPPQQVERGRVRGVRRHQRDLVG